MAVVDILLYPSIHYKLGVAERLSKCSQQKLFSCLTPVQVFSSVLNTWSTLYYSLTSRRSMAVINLLIMRVKAAIEVVSRFSGIGNTAMFVTFAVTED